MDELRRKRKYIPETEIETQCDDDDQILEQNSQTYSQHWENSEHLISIQEDTSTCIEKEMVDRSTCTENIVVDSTKCIKKTKDDERHVPTVLDMHGCKYFGQLVSNELLRFKPYDRNIKMQKILDLLRE